MGLLDLRRGLGAGEQLVTQLQGWLVKTLPPGLHPPPHLASLPRPAFVPCPHVGRGSLSDAGLACPLPPVPSGALAPPVLGCSQPPPPRGLLARPRPLLGILLGALSRGTAVRAVPRPLCPGGQPLPAPGSPGQAESSPPSRGAASRPTLGGAPSGQVLRVWARRPQRGRASRAERPGGVG